jgi:RHS repeat-associated protein
MSIDNLKRITMLPTRAPNEAEQRPPNPARAVQSFVGEVMSVVSMPMDMLNLGAAMATNWLANALPSFPAARLYQDLVLGWPHGHPHPPTFGFPLPSLGPVLLAGSRNVLINGLPAARCGDVGFGVWCGGYYPLFEVFTGSSNVFIGGARASRQFIDFTMHCLPFFGKLKKMDVAMTALGAGFSAVMGAIGVAAAQTDQANALAAAEAAETESDAKAAEAQAEAAGIEAAMTAQQTAADMAAMALAMALGIDPGVTPFTCWGNFITGSPNVLIGGLPMPGWMVIMKGLKKLLRRPARWLQAKVPPGSLRSRALCLVTGHPVDIASGRVFTSQTDFELPGRIPIVFTRNYDSSATDYEGPLGRGWIHPYDIHLWEDESEGMVILRTEEGMLVGFDQIEIGEKTFNPLEKRLLERLDEKVYVVRGKDGISYKFASIKDLDSDLDGKSEETALRLNEIEDRNGNKIRFIYWQGRLSSMENGVGTRLNFSYVTLDNGAVRLAGVNQALDKDSARTGKLVNFTYDSEGRLTNATDRGLVPWRYAYDNYLLIRETNRNGLSFHFEYRGEGKEARCVHTWGDGGIYERWLDYDRNTKMTVVENSLKAKTTYYFNEHYLPVRIVDALGGEKQFNYGSNGELVSSTDEIRRETKYLYNAQFDCIGITHPDGTMRRFAYTSDSLPEKLIGEAGAEFRNEYDDRGNITATIDALGHRREYGYNKFGDLERAVDPLGGATSFRWNENGQLIEFTTPLGATTRYRYNERGRLIEIGDPLGYATRYAYDAIDRLVQMERPDGTRHRYEYDPEGNLTNFLDANGAETRFRYVDNNKLGERIDALGYIQRFIYDTEANIVELGNERKEAYKFTYDALGRVTQHIGFDGLTSKYGYDPAGQLISRIDSAGRFTGYIRDLRGRVIERKRPDGSAVRFSYDNAGRLAGADAPGSELIFKHDLLGRVVWESQNGNVIEHEYDELGRRINRRSPSGHEVEFTYDADGLLRHLETPYGSMEFEYDRAGQITKRRLPSELEESFYYDRCGRMIEQSLHKPSHTILHRGYKYDAEGNLIELRDSNKGISHYVYDPVERLREMTQPEAEVERFVYDSTGNLLQRGTRKFHYGAPDRLTRADDAELVYDEIGNLIEKRRGSSVIRYSYDSDDRLIAVESKEGGRIEFAYDALGRRIVKKTKDGEIGFLWDGDVLLTEQLSDRSNEYVFRPGRCEPLCRFDEGNFNAYHHDYLGTVRELTDEKGNIVWSASLDVYGGLKASQVSETENQIRFPGQYEDTETGLYYNYYRYYDPDSGRYITQDPIGLWGGLNHYRYTNNPLTSIDPLGLVPSSDPGGFYVYALRLPPYPGETEGDVYYVGQTGHEATRQRGHQTTQPHPRHRESGPRLPADDSAFTFNILHSGLTYDEARGLEQFYIEHYQTRTGVWPNNLAHQIRPDRTDANAVRYRRAAENYLRRMGYTDLLASFRQFYRDGRRVTNGSC